MDRPNLDPFFKFKLGDMLIFKPWKCNLKSSKHEWSYERERTQKYYVIGRIVEECPGGVQLHYTCRAYNANGTADKLFNVNEFEVDLYEEPKDADNKDKE